MEFKQKKIFKNVLLNFKSKSLIYRRSEKGKNFEIEIFYSEIIPGVIKLKERKNGWLYTGLAFAFIFSLSLYVAIFVEKNAYNDVLTLGVFFGIITSVPFLIFFSGLQDIWGFNTKGGHSIILLNTKNRKEIADFIEAKLEQYHASHDKHVLYVEEEIKEETIQ